MAEQEEEVIISRASAFWLGCFIGATVFMAVYLVFETDYSQGYRQGQIDAIRGDIRYERVAPDSVWKEINR